MNKFPMYLSLDQIKDLEYEVVSTELKVRLTRELRDCITRDNNGDKRFDNLIIRQNDFINRSRNIQGLPLRILEPDDMGCYNSWDYAWHNGEFELIFRRLSVIELIEYIGDLIEDEDLSIEQVNDFLKRDGASFSYARKGHGKLVVQVLESDDIEALLAELDKENPTDKSHNNIRTLVQRAENCLHGNDVGGVVHACGSIFETLAKDVIADPKLNDKTLGSFFDKYRNESLLPAPILDYIKFQYDLRNATPLAGHGSLAEPNLSKEQALVLIEMTKAFVKSEYRLASLVIVGNITK